MQVGDFYLSRFNIILKLAVILVVSHHHLKAHSKNSIKKSDSLIRKL